MAEIGGFCTGCGFPVGTCSCISQRTMDDLLTLEQFTAEALTLGEKLPTLKTLLTDPRCHGYAGMASHLKNELHQRLGVEPVQMFRRVTPNSLNCGPDLNDASKRHGNMAAQRDPVTASQSSGEAK